MEEILRLKERVEIAIEIGESYYREFKSAVEGPATSKRPRDVREICSDIARTLVAFANADGGELFVGIEDNNNITGLPFADDKVDVILKAPETHVLKDTPLPLKRASLIDYNGQKIAYYSVEKGAKYVHLTVKGECFQRKDRESMPTASEQIRFVREEEASREYDRQFVDLAAITDLDLSLVLSVSQNIFKSISLEKFLQYLELAEFDGNRLRLRKAALLLFAKKISRWHPRCQVRILRVKGSEEKTGEDFNIKEVGEANGNIFELIENSWDLLRPHLTETRFAKDALFKTQIIYPELACREALINAITHRDYSLEGRGIEVKIFDDRLEVLSPGKLLSSITIQDLEELKGVHQSRNSYVARVLREFGYIRELGEGIRRIFELMRTNDLVKPKIESPNKSFIVTLYYKYVYSKEERLWLDNFEELNLTREQKTVVRLGIGGRLISAHEIFENVGIKDTEDYRLLLESLKKLGIFESIISSDKLASAKEFKKKGITRKKVPRFKIMQPNEKMPQIPNKANFELSDTADYARVFIGNLSYHATTNDVYEALRVFGDIVNIVIPMDGTNRSKGYGFVEFESKSSLEQVLAHKDPILINNRRVYIQKDKGN
jgi:ATP-dependent DNA helicase RecG